MRFAVLDDNESFLKSMKRAVSKYTEKPNIEYFTKHEEFLDYIKLNIYRLNGVFLDIVLGKTSGLEVARMAHDVNPDIKIAFVTGYVEEYCQSIFLNDFDITPFAFLTKPLNEDVLKKIFCKFAEYENSGSEENILVKTTDGYVYIPPSQICYLESQKRMVKISLANHTQLETYGKITDYSKQLESFKYSHKSFLVNLKCVKKFNSTEAIMINEEKIPISQRYKNQFKEQLLLNRGEN